MFEGLAVTGDRAAVPASRLDVEAIAGAVIDVKRLRDLSLREMEREMVAQARASYATASVNCSTRSCEPTGSALRASLHSAALTRRDGC